MWSMAPVANSCHALRTRSVSKAQLRSSQGLRVLPLENAFVRPAVYLHGVGVSTGVGSSKAWRARASMSLIAPESGRMLFCALTACAAVAQVNSVSTRYVTGSLVVEWTFFCRL